VKEIESYKNIVDINLEIILNLLRIFKDKQYEKIQLENLQFSNSLDSEDSSYDDSPQFDPVNDQNHFNEKKMNKIVDCIDENENFIENLEKFEQIVEILIKTSSQDLFREVKSIILNEYESTINQIKKYLETNKKESSKKFLTCISSNILFIISTITYKLDYYTITVNCLVDKLNKFFIKFVDETKSSNGYVKSLEFIQKFVKIKKTFIKDFIVNNRKIPEEASDNLTVNNISNNEKSSSYSGVSSTNETFTHMNSNNEKVFYNFVFNKFCSFGRFFFNNIFLLTDFNPIIDSEKYSLKGIDYNKIKDTNGCFINVYKYKLRKNIYETFFFNWKNKSKKYEFHKNKIIIDKYFIMLFNSKLASWKYATIQPGVKKTEICRICETKFEINEFVLHLFFCKELRMNNQGLIEIKYEMKKNVEKFNEYKE